MIQRGTSSGLRQAASETEAELQRATAAINLGRPEDGERFARNVLAGIPQHPKALYLLGRALLQQNRAAQAVAPLERAARALQDPAVETQLGIALREIGRTEDALARLRRATKRRPAHPEAFHELGLLLSSLGRADEAVTAVEHGFQLAPGASNCRSCSASFTTVDATMRKPRPLFRRRSRLRPTIRARTTAWARS